MTSPVLLMTNKKDNGNKFAVKIRKFLIYFSSCPATVRVTSFVLGIRMCMWRGIVTLSNASNLISS